MSVDDEISQTLADINLEIQNIAIKMSATEKNKDVFLGKLKDRLLFLRWVTSSWDIRNNKKGPPVIKQKEVFYCNLGINIGSEQNNNRPVIIIQNNIGNSYSNTTIIVPITSYENSKIYEKDGVMYIEYTEYGKKVVRKLDFYEIPISITPDSIKNIYGIANVAHIREVSKKRISKTPVAKITDDTYNKIIEAINNNLRNC